MGNTPARVLLVGGGLGGLTAALALRKAGLEAMVFEKARDLRHIQVGIGMVVWANGFRALRHVGLEEKAAAVGTRLEFLEFRGRSGKRLALWRAGDVSRKAGAPSVALSRGDLHRVLSDAMPGEALRLGSACAGFTAEDGRVTLRLADGSEQSGDVLVGADGLHSVVRAGLGLAAPGFPPYAGYTIWHSVIPFDLEKAGVPLGTFLLTFGRGSRFACYRIDESRVYWSGIGYVPAGGQDGAGGRKRDVLERFRGWHAPLEALIEATPEDDVHRVDIFGGQMLPRWGQGRVTLLGDAAHPMTTNLGQGASMAMEDAVALAEALSGGGDVPAALRGYEERRRQRVTAMMGLANKLNSTASLESAFRCWMRDMVIRFLFHRGLGRQYEQEMTRPL